MNITTTRKDITINLELDLDEAVGILSLIGTTNKPDKMESLKEFNIGYKFNGCLINLNQVADKLNSMYSEFYDELARAVN